MGTKASWFPFWLLAKQLWLQWVFYAGNHPSGQRRDCVWMVLPRQSSVWAQSLPSVHYLARSSVLCKCELLLPLLLLLLFPKPLQTPLCYFTKSILSKKITNVIHSLERKYEIFYENVGRKLNSSTDCWEKTTANSYCEFSEYIRSAYLFFSYKICSVWCLCVVHLLHCRNFPMSLHLLKNDGNEFIRFSHTID